MKPDLIRLADYENRVKIITGSGKPLSDKVKLIGIEIKNLHTDIFERICRNCKKEYTESNANSGGKEL
jgi:hypothetical protein